MKKKALGRRLNQALGCTISTDRTKQFYVCFSEHARDLARFYGIDESAIRPPAQLRLTDEFNDEETRLYCLYCGYDLTKSGTPPLW